MIKRRYRVSIIFKKPKNNEQGYRFYYLFASSEEEAIKMGLTEIKKEGFRKNDVKDIFVYESEGTSRKKPSIKEVS